MNADDVLHIYNSLAEMNVSIWIDGGWCIDALLEKETRYHADLDIAIDRSDEDKLSGFVLTQGWHIAETKDRTAWNYVLKRGEQQVDVHVFKYNDKHENIYGIKYPFGSLTGRGLIKGQPVNCIDPKWMYTFKTSYEPKEKDIADVQALAAKYSFELSEEYSSYF